VKTFNDGKTRMIGLPYDEKNYDNILSHFHLIPERHRRTDRQTGGQMDRIAISISRVSTLTRDNNQTTKTVHKQYNETIQYKIKILKR